MSRTPSRPHRPGTPAPGADRDHDPAPVDIASESVAGEEDPGAAVEPPVPDPAEAGEKRDRAQP